MAMRNRFMGEPPLSEASGGLVANSRRHKAWLEASFQSFRSLSRPALRSVVRMAARMSRKAASRMGSRAIKIRLILLRSSGISGVTASRMRRLTRLLTTLLPIFLLTENVRFSRPASGVHECQKVMPGGFAHAVGVPELFLLFQGITALQDRSPGDRYGKKYAASTSLPQSLVSLLESIPNTQICFTRSAFCDP